MEGKNCVFCSDSLSKGNIVIVRKGLNRLIESSKEREDELWQKFVNLEEIQVHVNCRRMYTKPSSITATKRKQEEQGHEEEEISTKPSLRSVSSFSYKNCCLFCMAEVSAPNPKLPKNRRRRITQVETMKIQKSILAKCDERRDKVGEGVKYRVMHVDLIAEEARYHNDCYVSFRHVKEHERGGRPTDDKHDVVLKLLFDYIENQDECQYTLPELKEAIKHFPGGEQCKISDYILKARLKHHFKKRIIVTEAFGGRPLVISFVETAHNLLYDQWYSERKKKMENERLRIVEMAAEIIRQDIRGKFFDLSKYPSLDEMGTGGSNLIPQSLKVFMDIVIQGSTRKGNDKSRAIITISHSIISACRPRSFISPVQLALAVHLHSKYGSRHLIDLLHSMSLSASYNETVAYLNVANDNVQPEVSSDAFIQFVFDNADVNTRTIDGHGTIHILGGIKCVTPGDAVLTSPPLVRDIKKKMNVAMNSIPLVHYRKPSRLGLKNLKIKSINVTNVEVDVIKNGFQLNLHWIAGFLFSESSLPFWNGYMQEAMQEAGNYQISKILPMPFIHLDAGNLTTINSALTFAASECNLRNTSCIVTFDQPLFIKACEIVEAAEKDSPISSVIVRLGGFHLLMSYLGCIGNIMKGSGIEELWGGVYAKSTVPHLMSGHAFSRSLRAHFLTVVALFQCLIDKFPSLKSEALDLVVLNSEKLIRNEISPEEIKTSRSVSTLVKDVLAICKGAEETSRTAKLWIQYIKMVILVMEFIRAERTGDFTLHVNTVISMLPFFHAAGHNLYAKSAHLYVQKMLELPCKMKDKDFVSFSEQGFFCIRRAARFWSGTWSDMVIEQSLMRPMKSIGGLTHGRGITDKTLLRWTTSLPLCTEVTKAVENFTGVFSKTSEQHTEENPGRQFRDSQDQEVFCKWLMEHNPFQHDSGELVCLSTGLVGDISVTCDKAREIGEESMKKMQGKEFGTVTIKRKCKVKPLAGVSSAIMLREDTVIIKTQQIFNRIICVEKDQHKLKEFFSFELAARPPSLFDDVSLRKGVKSSLVKAFQFEESPNILYEKCFYILDGGHLLHSVIWPRPATYGEVVNCYISYIKSHYGSNCLVVFDGYPDEPTTKWCEQQMRAFRRTSATIQPQENTVTTTTQAEFLANSRNKKAFIELLAGHCLSSNIQVRLAKSDADSLIVSTALEKAHSCTEVIVIGQDTDLLVLLTSFASETDKIQFLRPASGYKTQETVFTIPRQQTLLGETREVLLFAHAVTGCDTTSALFKKGKLNALKLLQKDPTLREGMKVFNNPSSTKEEVAAAGEEFLLRLYGRSRSTTLDDLRYYRYNHLISKQPVGRTFDLASLPPTSDAAAQHSYRVYLQVQQWKGNELNPTDWGWIRKGDTLSPVCMTRNPAPPELLTLISCTCKYNCTNRCECRRSGLKCSAMCRDCQGVSCMNSEETIELMSDDEDDNLLV